MPAGTARPLEAATSALLELARAGSPRPAIALVLDLVHDGFLVDDLIRRVLGPVQLEVGERWESNRWTTADEHAATAVIDGVLGALAVDGALPDVHLGRVLVACAEGEHHTMPARMGAQLLRSEGWDVTFLGGSVPADDLQRYAAVTEPDAVVVSCTVPLFLAGARRCFAGITELGVPAIAAGHAFGVDAGRARRVGASGWIDPAQGLVAALSRTWAPQPAPTPPEAVALELAAEDLRRACVTSMAERMPGMATHSAAQLAGTRADVDRILGFLVTAIDLGDDEVFTAFLEWLAHVLQGRGSSPAVLETTLEIIGEVLAEAGMAEARRLCATRPPADARG